MREDDIVIGKIYKHRLSKENVLVLAQVGYSLSMREMLFSCRLNDMQIRDFLATELEELRNPCPSQ